MKVSSNPWPPGPLTVAFKYREISSFDCRQAAEGRVTCRLTWASANRIALYLASPQRAWGDLREL